MDGGGRVDKYLVRSGCLTFERWSSGLEMCDCNAVGCGLH